MNKHYLNFIKAIFILSLAFTINLAYGDINRSIFNSNAKMLGKHREPVDKTYGLINIVTGNDGKGTINVMFSNGSKIDWVKFNAHVKFLNAAGLVIKEAHFYRWLNAANEEGASERKISKALTRTDYTSIEVEFYLTDIPEPRVVEPGRIDVVRAFLQDRVKPDPY